MSVVVPNAFECEGQASAVAVQFVSSLWTLLLGLAIVALVLPLSAAALIAWVALLSYRALHLKRTGRRNLAWATVVTQVLLMGAVVVAAHLAPMKTTEHFLDRTLVLPRQELTLADLAGEPDALRPEWMPRWISITAADEERLTLIRFDSAMLTTRQFVGTVERQSTLRHRFSHCGNGWTVLWGGDCCFGLYMRRPREGMSYTKAPVLSNNGAHEP